MSWLNCLSRKNPEFDDVKVLDFSRSALTEVPSVVFNFERTLDCLYLDGNKICDLPRTLFQCEELRYLNLSDNEIQNIPPLLVKLGSLQYLNLSRNYLKHTSIPANIHKCQKLIVLDLSSNNLEKLPECVTSLVSLQELYLNDTFIDFFPATVGRLNNLHILELRDNMLSMLPKSLKRLTGLQRLDLSNNDFCELPEVIQNLQNLTELWINGNCVKVIPPEIGNLRKLLHFDASNNEIETLPREIGLWSNITFLALSENMLKEIPAEICKLRQLETLKLDHNYIEHLPENLGNLKNLEDLDLRFNNLKSLPNSIGMLRKLNCLIASNNYITSLPPEIGSCCGLRILNLDVNLIVHLPQEIGHIQNLVSVSLINNKLQFLPITVLKLSKLRALWLSQNQNQPLISLQKDRRDSGQIVLTCIFLPQAVASPMHNTQLVYPSPNRRKICFTEPGVQKDFAPHLTRAPTPYPKDYQRYRKSVANILRRQKDLDSSSLRDLSMPVVKEAVVAPAKMTDEDNFLNLPLPPDNTSQHYSKKSLNDNYLKTVKNTDVDDSGIEDKVQKNDIPSLEGNSADSYDNHFTVGVDSNISVYEYSSKPQILEDKSERNHQRNIYLEDCSNQNYNNYHHDLNSDTSRELGNLKTTPDKLNYCNLRNPQDSQYGSSDDCQTDHSCDQNQNFSATPETFTHQTNTSAEEVHYDDHSKLEQNPRNDNKKFHNELKTSYDNPSSVNRPLQIHSSESTTSNNSVLKNENRFTESSLQMADYSLRKEIKPPPYHIAAAYSKNAHFFNDINKQAVGATVKSQVIEEKPKHFTQDQPTNIIMPQPQHPFRSSQEESTQRLDAVKSGFDEARNVYSQCQNESANANKSSVQENKVQHESSKGNEPMNKEKVSRSNLIASSSSRQDNEAFLDDNQSYKEMDSSEKNSHLQGWIFGKHRNRRILECPVKPTTRLGFDYVTTNEGIFVTNVIDTYNKGNIMVGDKILMVDDLDLAMYPINSSVKYLMEAGPNAEKFLVSRE